jgi:hypothetical protein
MRKLKPRHLADFVRSPATDAQLLELWTKIERTEARQLRRARQLRAGAAGAAVVGALIGFAALPRAFAPAPVASSAPMNEPAAAAIEAPQQLSLVDGSRLVLSTGTRARVLAMRSDEVRVRLERGQVDCEVAPDRGRRFIIEAGGFEVVVTGTRFTVVAEAGAGSASDVAVSVERGSVQVWEASQRLLASLGAGQRWASERPAGLIEPPDAGLEAAPHVAASHRAASSAASSAPAASAGAASRADSSRAGSGAPRAAATAPAPRSDASTLLARASAARRAGHLPDAVAALERVVLDHPRDERAGYAAFLLGRIQLDSLGDARAAVESFSFAAAHPGSGFFQEDAEARRVEALARAGRRPECADARDRFLAKYPRAARATSIRRVCDED